MRELTNETVECRVRLAGSELIVVYAAPRTPQSVSIPGGTPSTPSEPFDLSRLLRRLEPDCHLEKQETSSVVPKPSPRCYGEVDERPLEVTSDASHQNCFGVIARVVAPTRPVSPYVAAGAGRLNGRTTCEFSQFSRPASSAPKVLCGAAMRVSERTVRVREVGGSNPLAPT
jgi:hypothetical protein